jgi:hypothetical protein
MQNTTHLLMILPVNFGFNQQTAVNNSFQKNIGGDTRQKALEEFTFFVDLLRRNNIAITVVEDSPQPVTPDAVFPNNWISFHADGRVFLYPMFAENRRLERKAAVLDTIKKEFTVTEIIDLSTYEKTGLFLEGTGSMVLDREHKIAYASLSPRTDETLLNEFCRLTGFKAVTFNACDEHSSPVYHTNVMMCVARTFAVVCLEAIADDARKRTLISLLTATGKEIVEITMHQMNNFAGNMLQVINAKEELLLVMSTQAYGSLTSSQIKILQKHNRIIHADLSNIETAGGGSARCMMAEVFLPVK